MRLLKVLSLGSVAAIFAGAAAYGDIGQAAPGITIQALEFVLADLVFENPAALASARLPSSATRAYVVATRAATSPARGACGVRFKKGATKATGAWGEVLNASSGVYWTPVYSSSPVKTCEFGTIGDADYSYDRVTGAQTVTGANNQPMFQAAIDFAIQNGWHSIEISDGKYRIDDTIHLGYGGPSQIYGLDFRGSGRPSFSATLPGVAIFPSFYDRPAINIQGGREVRLSGFALKGMDFGWVRVKRANPVSFSATASDWINPLYTPTGRKPGGLQPHSPYVGIAIDAYKGPQPNDYYPTVSYPRWTGISQQYDKAPSSDITIDNVDVGGFAVAIGTPNGDGNGDFIRIRDSQINDGAYGIAITHTQSRNVEIRNINYSGLHTFLTNRYFGIGNGMLSGPIDNVSGGAGYQIVDIALGVSGPIKFTHLYTEDQVRIGYLNASGAFPANVTFDSCNIDLHGNGVHDSAPPFMIEAAGDPEISFKNTQIVGSTRMFNLINATGATIVIDGGWFSSAYDITGPTRGRTAYSRAINLTGGVLFGGGSAHPDYPLNVPTVKIVSPFKASRAITTSPYTLASQPIGDMLDFSGQPRWPANLYASGFYDTQNHRWTFGRPPPTLLLDLSSPAWTAAPPAFTDDRMTLEYLDIHQRYTVQKMHVGDVLFHLPTGTIFVITTIGAQDPTNGNAWPITATQMNNMLINADGTFRGQSLKDLSLAGNTLLLNASIDLPVQVYYGDYDMAGNVTNVHRGDGYAGDIAQYLSPGDVLFPYAMNDAYLSWPINSSLDETIASVTVGSPASLRLAGGGAVRAGRFPIYPLPISAGR